MRHEPRKLKRSVLHRVVPVQHVSTASQKLSGPQFYCKRALTQKTFEEACSATASARASQDYPNCNSLPKSPSNDALNANDVHQLPLLGRRRFCERSATVTKPDHVTCVWTRFSTGRVSDLEQSLTETVERCRRMAVKRHITDRLNENPAVVAGIRQPRCHSSSVRCGAVCFESLYKNFPSSSAYSERSQLQVFSKTKKAKLENCVKYKT